MRQISAVVCLGFLLMTVGCLPRWHHLRNQTTKTRLPAGKPTVPQLVSYLNKNSRQIDAIEAKIDMDCKQGRQSVGVTGYMVCEKPRNFRLKAKILGKNAVDLGSNEREFWYWISQADPPYVYHCSYEDLARGAYVPFPFQPDLVVAALGMGQYDETNTDRYTLREHERYLELIEPIRSPRNEKQYKVTVFRRDPAGPNKPQVVSHLLADAKGNLICKATIRKTTTTREGLVIPRQVKFVWPAQKVELSLTLYDPQTKQINPERKTKLFERTDLARLESYDLGRRQLDGSGGTRQATYLDPRERGGRYRYRR